MTDVDLTTTATVPEETSLTITVYEDVDGDGSAENVASQAIDDGTNTYSLSGFEFESGNEFWLEAEFDTDDVTKTAELDSAGIEGSPVQRVCASLSTLQFIPGKSENPSQDGHPLNSGLMHIFPEGGKFNVWGVPIDLPVGPVFDNWMGGDMTEELPESLEEARKPVLGKYSDDVGPDAFKEYRIENGVEICFETLGDGTIDKDTVEITFSEAGSDPDDPIVFRGDQENSRSVLHDHPLNSLPWEEWYGENVRPSNRQPRYYSYDLDFEFDGVEGVRLFTIWGGWAGFMGDVSERVSENPVGFLGTIWDWPVPDKIAEEAFSFAPTEVQFLVDSMSAIPNTYSVLEFILLADGRRYARVWDASQYPSLATYVDGRRESLDRMPYEPQEAITISHLIFHLLAMAQATPYQSSPRYYSSFVEGHPLIVGEVEELLEDLIETFDLGLLVHEIMPTIPRATLGFHDAEGNEPITDPDAPFDAGILWAFPFSKRLFPD